MVILTIKGRKYYHGHETFLREEKTQELAKILAKICSKSNR